MLLLVMGCQQRAKEQNRVPELIINTGLIEKIEDKLTDYPVQTEFAAGFIQNGKVGYYGAIHNEDGIKAVENAQSVFEIGSITKVFTAQLLAQAVLKEEIDLQQPLQDFFDFKVRHGEQITLRQLASHSSGLPSLPASFLEGGYDEANPYKDFSENDLLQYLENELSVDTAQVGHFNYSNIGMAVLGHVLTRHSGQGYEAMLQKQILKPLSMGSSSTKRSGLEKKLVGGLLLSGERAQCWDLNAIAPAGGLYSTVADLVKYMESCFDPGNKAFQLQKRKILKKSRSMDQGLGWMRVNYHDRVFYLHAGGTGGYSALMIIDPESESGLILLSNIESGENGVDRFGVDLFIEMIQE